MKKSKGLYVAGKKVGKAYYLAGAHVYEFFRQGGNARVAFSESDSNRMLWQENGGLAVFNAYDTGIPDMYFDAVKHNSQP